MKEAIKFKTKIGYCHILDDKIVMTKQENLDDLEKVKPPYSKTQSMIVVVILIGIMLYLFYDASTKQDQSGMVLSGILSFFSIVLSINVFSNSAQPIIAKYKIQELKFMPGLTGFTRARFAITFKDDDGKTKKSLIVLPGTLAGGRAVAIEAEKMMKAAFPNFLGKNKK